jgi:hypothetical protein
MWETEKLLAKFLNEKELCDSELTVTRDKMMFDEG